MKARHAALRGEGHGVEQQELDRIEAALGVELPADVRAIAEFFGGGLLGGKEHHAIRSSGLGSTIVRETLRLRVAIGLPARFVVLAEPAESLLVLDCARARGESCGATHPMRSVSASRRSFAHPPEEWASYADFFAFLLDEEEGERA